MWLGPDTIVGKFTVPLKGKYWDFAISGVAFPGDLRCADNNWQFPNNMASFMILNRRQQPPHGIHVHTLIVLDKHPFQSDIVVAVKDTVVTVTSEMSLAWPDHSRFKERPTDDDSQSDVCLAFHMVRIHLRRESFRDDMLGHITVGIVIAADRFTPPLWDDVEGPMSQCDVCIVSTRGGGDMFGADKERNEVAYWVERGCRRVANQIVSENQYRTIGHNPIHTKT